MKFRLEQLRDLKELVRELTIGLRNLTFSDNFQSFEATVVIPATSEAQVRNQLTSVPKKFIVVDQKGNGLITRSSTEWNENQLYLFNNGAVEVTATIVFMES